jgi:archaemetzincin
VASAIHILNASAVADEHLLNVSRAAGRIFGLKADVSPAHLALDRAFDPSRQQYNSTALLAQLVRSFSGSQDKYAAIVTVDLHIPILTFVFGEAQLDGIAAVVSIHRLANQFYGLPRDDQVMLERLGKEVVHELGHTFGLYHCHHFECVMRSSTYVEEIDLKRNWLCDECQARLDQQR